MGWAESTVQIVQIVQIHIRSIVTLHYCLEQNFILQTLESPHIHCIPNNNSYVLVNLASYIIYIFAQIQFDSIVTRSDQRFVTDISW